MILLYCVTLLQLLRCDLVAYFVEFNNVYGDLTICETNYNTFELLMKRNDYVYSVRRRFCSLFNGLSIDVDPLVISLVSNFDIVSATYPITNKKLPQYQQGNGETSTYQKQNYINSGVQRLKDEFGLDGKGIRIGIIDTGIDYTHPSFGNCFNNLNCKVGYGRNFVRSSNYTTENNTPMDECSGHGTHVAGIIGADDENIQGIATRATIGAYRIFGCNNKNVESDVIVEALEAAYEDKMDIVNLSFGGSSSWPEYPDSKAATRLAETGVFVVGAAGNDGEDGMFMINSPSVGDGVFSVASYDSSSYIATAFSLSTLPFSRLDYSINSKGVKFNVESVPIVFPVKDNYLCFDSENDENIYSGKIVVSSRGNCSFELKAILAQKYGAIGIIIVNNNEDIFTPAIKDDNIKIPVIGVSELVGRVVSKALRDSNNTDVLLSTPRYFLNPNSDKISPFSSWGPGPELELKPDISAPGSLIYSTFPVKMGGYSTLSGTSMAAPYISGIIALLLQYHNKNPINLRNNLLITATPVLEKDSQLMTSVTRQGSGAINAYASAVVETSIYPSKIKISEKSASFIIKTLKIINNSLNKYFSYEIEHLPSNVITSYINRTKTSTPLQRQNVGANVLIDKKSGIVLGPGEHKILKLRFEPPNTLNKTDYWIYSGYIRIQTNQTEIDKLHIPYLGVVGDYSTLSILDSEPKLDLNNKLIDSKTNKLSINSNDTLKLLVKLKHPTKSMLVKLLESDTDKEMCYLINGIKNYVSKNDMVNQYYPFNLGNYCISNYYNKYKYIEIQSNTYKLKVETLRPMGNLTSKNDFFSWVSIPINYTKK